MRHLMTILWALGALGVPAAASDRELIDLTYPYSAETVYWPTADGFRLEVLSFERTDAGYFYAANEFCTAEHGGTHIDSPIHFAEGRWTVDEIPLDRLIAPGVLVDVSGRTADARDYRVQVADLTAWEGRHGRLPDGAILLLRTGWGRRYPDPARYLGTARRGAEAVAELHFPGLHPAAARWLVENRKVASVGIDTASIDHGPSTRFAAHVALFEANIPVFENIANLDRLPETGFRIIALPMKIEGGSGGPLRIVAVLD